MFSSIKNVKNLPIRTLTLKNVQKTHVKYYIVRKIDKKNNFWKFFFEILYEQKSGSGLGFRETINESLTSLDK